MRDYLDLLLERSTAQWTLCILGGVLALASLDYVLLYRPQSGNIARIAADLEIARVEQARLRRQAGPLPRLREDLAALRRVLRSRLRHAAEPGDPLERVAARAATADLEMVRFQPGAAVAGEFLAEVPLAVEFTGTFHDLLRFLRAATPDAAPDTRRLAITALPAAGGATPLRIAMELVTLRLPPRDPVGETGTGPEADARPLPASRMLPAPAGSGDAAREAHEPAEEARRGVSPPDATPLGGPGASPLPRDPFRPYRPPPPPAIEMLPQPAPEPAAPRRFRATGIVWGTHHAATLVKDDEGHIHVVQPGSRLGDDFGRVTAITPCEIVLETPGADRQPRETRLPVRHCHPPKPADRQ